MHLCKWLAISFASIATTKKPEPPKRPPENESKTDSVGEFHFRVWRPTDLAQNHTHFLNSPTLSKLGAKPFDSCQHHRTTMDKIYVAPALQLHEAASG